VRPAWARSWRWKSLKLATASVEKPNCEEATNCGEEGWIASTSRCTRIGYKAMPIRASGHDTAKLLWSTVRRRRSGGCMEKDCVRTWGDQRDTARRVTRSWMRRPKCSSSRGTTTRAAGRLGFSARSHDRILRVARTIADMDGSERVGLAHLAEATAYRLPERAGPALRDVARAGA